MKIGLSLGGGGAKGFAHLPILEVFDELGLRPGAISGSSIGA
ncbi:MAG: patatin-like phospholipase family protein, partial [Spirochaetota bacterium]